MKHLVLNDAEHQKDREVEWLLWRLEYQVSAKDWERAGKLADQILDLVKERTCPGH